ncbi:MAG: hypothetical protein HC890_04900, partial [Chloroflexaceae bacterium]|nr:hypothetical protein [Chloroflexaceae bacterium]
MAKSSSPAATLTPKERLAQKQRALKARQELTTAITASAITGLILGIPAAFLGSPLIGVATIVGIPVVVLSFLYPRTALWAFLIYMPFSGTITYAIGKGHPIFQLAKDFLYFPALLGLFLQCRREGKPILVNKSILITLVLLLFSLFLTLFLVNFAQEFLPACSELTVRFIPRPEGGEPIAIPCQEGQPLLQGIFGLKVIIGYIPLIFCAYHLIGDRKRLVFFGRLLLVLVMICCFLGLAQYGMLRTGRCAGTRNATGADLFEPTLEARCLAGGALLFSPSHGQIRLPGTFVSPWHWAWYLISGGTIAFVVAFGDPALLWRLTGIGGLTLVMMNTVISGQRLALAVVPASIAALILLTGQVAKVKRFFPAAIALTIILVVIAGRNPQVLQERVDSFVGRWNASPPHLFLQNQFSLAQREGGILGQGLGKGTNASRFLGPTAFFETFHSKMVYEAGWPGLIAFLLFATNLTVSVYFVTRSVRDRELRNYGASLWVYILIISYFPHWYPLDTDPVAVYYWFFAGVVFRLPEIAKQEQDQAAVLPASNPAACPARE